MKKILENPSKTLTAFIKTNTCYLLVKPVVTYPKEVRNFLEFFIPENVKHIHIFLYPDDIRLIRHDLTDNTAKYIIQCWIKDVYNDLEYYFDEGCKQELRIVFHVSRKSMYCDIIKQEFNRHHKTRYMKRRVRIDSYKSEYTIADSFSFKCDMSIIQDKRQRKVVYANKQYQKVVL